MRAFEPHSWHFCNFNNIKISHSLYLVINLLWFKYVDRLDRVILKFIAKVGMFSDKDTYERDCLYCSKKEIDGNHFIDECQQLVESNKYAFSILNNNNSSDISNSSSLSELIRYYFFNMKIKDDIKQNRIKKKNIYKIFEVMINKIKNIYKNNKDNGDVDGEYDNI